MQLGHRGKYNISINVFSLDISKLEPLYEGESVLEKETILVSSLIKRNMVLYLYSPEDVVISFLTN